MNIFRKKIILILLAVLTALSLTGCIRVNIDIAVNKNGKADISMLYAMQDSMSSMMEGESAAFSAEDVEEARKNGWEVQDYSAEGYSGYTMSIKNVSLQDAMEAFKGEGGGLEKNGNKYKLSFRFFSQDDAKEIGESGALIKSMGGFFTIRMTLPVKPAAHNATSVMNDGKTLEWDLLTMNTAEPVYAEFTLPGSGLLPILLVIILIAAAVFIVLKRKKMAAGRAAGTGEAGYGSGTVYGAGNAAYGSGTAAGVGAGGFGNSSAAVPAAPGRTCTSCGAPLGDGDTFCSVCGSRQERRFCQSCGMMMNPGERFCQNCGADSMNAGQGSMNAEAGSVQTEQGGINAGVETVQAEAGSENAGTETVQTGQDTAIEETYTNPGTDTLPGTDDTESQNE